MHATIKYTNITDSSTNSYDINIMPSPLMHEISFITGSNSFYLTNSESSLLHASLRTGNWDEYNEKFGEKSPRSFSSIRKYSGYNFDVEKIPVAFSLGYQKTIDIDTKSLNRLVINSTSTNSPENLYPIATRYIDTNGNYYIERPPFQLEVDMRLTRRNSASAKRSLPHKIWVPWTLTVYTINHDMKIYFSHSSLESMESKYVPCILPNTYSDARICFASSLMNLIDDHNDHTNIRTNYSLMFNEYMNGGWNLDLSPNLCRYTGDLFLEFYHNKKNFKDKYPALSLFYSPPEDYVKKHFPKMNASRRENFNYISQNNSFSKIYNYMFSIMSTFTVEKTLQFYKELTDAFSEIYSNSGLNINFKTIIDRELHFKRADSVSYLIDSYYSLPNAIKVSMIEKNIPNETSLGGLVDIIFKNYPHSLTAKNNSYEKMFSKYFNRMSEYSQHRLIQASLSIDPVINNNYIIYDFADDSITISNYQLSAAEEFSNIIIESSGSRIEQEITI